MVPDAQANSQSATSLNETISFLRQWLPLALFCGLVAGAAAFVMRSALPPSYTAGASLLLAAPQAGLESIGVVTPPLVDPAVYRAAILEGGILAGVLEQQGLPAGTAAEREFARQVSVSIDNQQISSIIRIRVRAPAALRAAQGANLIASELLQWDRDRGLQALLTGVTALQESLAGIDSQLAAAAAAGQEADVLLEATRGHLAADLAAARERVESLTVGPLLRVLNEAAVPLEPDDSRAAAFALLAFIAGSAGILGLGWLAKVLRNSVQQAAGVERLTGLPVLATLPDASRRRAPQARRDAADILRDRLAADQLMLESVVILVTSPTDASEKNGAAVALAESFGRAGHQTLLLDADLRSPSSGEEFRLNEDEFVSLEQFLTDPGRRLEFVSIRLEGRRVFSLIPSFTPAGWPADRLRGSLDQLLGQWRRRFPIIIIDAAPLLPFPDTGGIIDLADAVILTARLGASRREPLRQAVEVLTVRHGKVPRLVVSEAKPALGSFNRISRTADDYVISILRAPREAGRSEGLNEFSH
jgi:Mrp family chromosome partitioning ATPase